jgi:hypothetical protein
MPLIKERQMTDEGNDIPLEQGFQGFFASTGVTNDTPFPLFTAVILP